MARNTSKKRSKKRDWRQIAFFAFNFIVVLSMALGYVLLMVARQ
jgi:hypothetical protein